MVLGLYGASGLGTEYMESARVINEKENRWEEMFFVDDDPEKVGTFLGGKPIYSYKQAIELFGLDGVEFVLSVGEPAVKDIIFKKLMTDGAKMTSLIDPEVRLPLVYKHGPGLVFKRNSYFPPNADFGNNVLIQGTAILGHNLVLGDNVVISSLSFVGGDTKIGRNTYVGPSSCIRNGLTIGENAIIGMGSVVTKDVPDNAVVYGNPAKIVRYNESGRVFKK